MTPLRGYDLPSTMIVMPKSNAKRPSSIDITVGHNVRLWRMAKGMSQAQLANRLGVTFQQLQKYEAGFNRIGTGRLAKVATVFEVPISVLFEGIDGTEPSRSLQALVCDTRSFRLADAFAAVKDSTLRLSLLNLIERIAATVPQTRRRRRN